MTRRLPNIQSDDEEDLPVFREQQPFRNAAADRPAAPQAAVRKVVNGWRTGPDARWRCAS